MGVVYLTANLEDRACDLAAYMIENKATVRAAAAHFGISKSTVHTDRANRNGCTICIPFQAAGTGKRSVRLIETDRLHTQAVCSLY